MKILIADDSHVQRLILRRHLETAGHEVIAAVNGDEAWSLFQADRFSLVISDWMMPGLDGPSLCRRIRGVEEDFYTYVILLTGRSGDGDRLEGLDAGADDFLTKPIDTRELTVRLKIARRILGVQEKLREQNERLADLATTDGLTGLKNRREFQRALDSAFAVAIRQGFALSLVLFDVDHFKSFNDTFGHLGGDDVLRRMGSILKENCREHETAARYGGEEFALVVLGARADDGRDMAERIRRLIAGSEWPGRPITASFGVATLGPRVLNSSALIEHADRALYHSKGRGRNCVSHADDGDTNTQQVASSPAALRERCLFEDRTS